MARRATDLLLSLAGLLCAALGLWTNLNGKHQASASFWALAFIVAQTRCIFLRKLKE